MGRLAGNAQLLPVTLQDRLFRQIQQPGVAAEVTADEDRCSQAREIVGFERLDDCRVQTEMVGDVTLFGAVAGTDLVSQAPNDSLVARWLPSVR